MKDAEHSYLNKNEWAKKAIYNVANVGYFSSDRAVDEYAKKIWHVYDVTAENGVEETFEAKSA